MPLNSVNAAFHERERKERADKAEIAKAAARKSDADNAGTVVEGGKDTNRAKGRRV